LKTARKIDDFYTVFWNDEIDEDMVQTGINEYNTEGEKSCFDNLEEVKEFYSDISNSQAIISIQIMNDYYHDEGGDFNHDKNNIVEPQDGIMFVYEKYDSNGNPIAKHYNECETDEEIDKYFDNCFSILFDSKYVRLLGEKLIEAADKVEENLKKFER
jgi:hypothetical protein